MKLKLLFSCAFVGGLTLHIASLQAADQPKHKTPWKITGQLEEACSCDAACPCWFNSKPTKMTCGGGQVLFIRSDDETFSIAAMCVSNPDRPPLRIKG